MPNPNRSSSWARVQDTPLFWLLPAGFFLLFFYTWPLLDVIRLSFTNASLVTADYDYTLDSYRRVLQDPSTLRTLKITLLFAGGSVILKLVIGMGLALAIDAGVKRGLHGIVLVRTSVLAAWVIPGVVVGVLWKILLSTSSHGLLNYWIQMAFGESVGFLSDPKIALLTTILANVWRGVAFTMILIYAGLQRIPPELYEAARVDGAGALARFRFVTLPTLAPVIFIALVLITIGGINTFDLIMALTEGGPARSTEVVGMRVYQQVFQFMNLGRGAALAVLLLAVNLIMTLLYLRLLRLNRKID